MAHCSKGIQGDLKLPPNPKPSTRKSHIKNNHNKYNHNHDTIIITNTVYYHLIKVTEKKWNSNLEIP